MSSSQTSDRSGKESERFRRDRPATTPEAARATSPAGGRAGFEALANPWPDVLGIWSADGRSLSQQGLNDNLRATERLMQGWQRSLESQRLAMDAMRDLLRRQQDMMLTSTMALLGAALNMEGAAGGNAEASPMERAAASCGSAWRRTLEINLANCWVGFEAPGAANAPAQPGGRTDQVA